AVKHDTPGGNAMAFAPDGRRALIGGRKEDGSVELWDVERNKFQQLIASQGVPIVFMAFLPDGKNCVIVWTDGEIRTCALDNGAEIRSVYALPASCAELSSDGKRIAIGTGEGPIQVWELETSTKVHQYTGHDGNVWSEDFSAAGKQQVPCGEDATLRLRDVQTGKEIRKRDGVPVTRGYFAADG